MTEQKVRQLRDDTRTETTEVPATLFAALARFQADLPRILKSNTAKVPGKDGKQGYTYDYADLADVSDAVLKRMGSLGLFFTAWPLHREEDGKFGLAYTLGHASGERQDGWWELRSDLPMQQMGGMITYARRYILLAVTGAHPDGEDDDAASSQHVPSRKSAGDAWEEASPAPPRRDDGPYRRMLAEAANLKTDAAAARITSQAKAAAKRNEITLDQEGSIQDRIQRSLARLHETAQAVDVEDLARQAAGQITTDEAAGSPEGEPGTVSPAQLRKLHTVFTGLGFNGEDREQKLVIAEVITGRAPLAGPEEGRSSKNLSLTEARKLIDTLDGFEDRDALIAFMADHEQAGDGDDLPDQLVAAAALPARLRRARRHHAPRMRLPHGSIRVRSPPRHGGQAMSDHSGCRDVLRRQLAIACGRVGEPDMDLVVSTAPPLLKARPGQWQPMACTCPHGTTYWIEPTGEQRAKWRAEAMS